MEELTKNNKELRFGLNPLPRDDRDFKLGAIVDLPELSELPKEFILEPLSIKYQGGSDLCTAFASCGVSELQEGVELSPEWSFAVSKKISGDMNGFGQDLRSAMKAHIKYGAIEVGETDKTLEKYDYKYLRDIKNYDPYLFDKAVEHKKKCYVAVDGRYDPFDNIRATIWKFRNEKRAVMSGALWSWSMKNPIISSELSISGIGHAFYYVGWKIVNGNTRLVLVNSYGNWSGDNGLFYIPRNIVNPFAGKFGAYTLLDENPEEIKKQQWTVMQRLLGGIKNILLKFKQILQ